MRGLLIGRYQPFHRGHLEVLLEVMGKVDELIIGIGSAQESHTEENPFTAGERIEMIRLCLDGEQKAKTLIIPIPDVNRYAIWVSHIESLVPPFELVFTNNPLTKSLFEEWEYNVLPTPMFDREIYSGREIRERIMNDEPWEDLVPEQTVDFLKSLDGKSRISANVQTDEE